MARPPAARSCSTQDRFVSTLQLLAVGLSQLALSVAVLVCNIMTRLETGMQQWQRPSIISSPLWELHDMLRVNPESVPICKCDGNSESAIAQGVAYDDRCSKLDQPSHPTLTPTNFPTDKHASLQQLPFPTAAASGFTARKVTNLAGSG
jgi:hypothetical protein